MALDVILSSIYGISCATMELYEQVKHLFHDLKPPIPKVSSSSYRLYPPTLFDDIRSEVNDHHGFLVRLTHNLVVALGWWSIDFAPWLLEMSGRVAVVMARVTELVVHINALPQELPGFNWMIVPTVTSQWPSTYGTQTMLSDNMSWMSSQLSGLNSHASSSGTMTTPTRTRSQWPPPTMSSSRTRSFTQTTPSDKSTQWSSSSLSGSNTLASSSRTTTSQLSFSATSYSSRPSKCTSSSSTTTRSRVRPTSTVPSSTNDRVARSSSMGSRTSSHSDTASFCSTRAYRHYSGISYRPTK